MDNFQRKLERYSEQVSNIIEEKIKKSDDDTFSSEINTILKDIQSLNVNINMKNSEEENVTGMENNGDQGNYSAVIENSTLKKDMISGKYNYKMKIIIIIINSF